MVYTHEKDNTGLVMGSIDKGSLRGGWPKVKKHIHVDEKAPWTMIPDDGAPQMEGSEFAHLVQPYSKPR